MTEESAKKGKQQVKRERAIALRYNDANAAPQIIASGAGEIAKRIKQLAADNNIPIREDESLADMLAKLEVGSAISPESYRLVAEILCFLYHTDKKWREANPHLHDLMGPPLDPEKTDE